MYSQNHMLLQWTANYRPGGRTEPAFEIAVGSLRFAGPIAIEQSSQSICDALAAALSSYWADQFVKIPSNCFLTTVKWNQIGRDGRYALQTETMQTEFAGVAGASSALYPSQIAWATTWDTDTSRGRAHAGRTYWPTAQAVSPLTYVVSQGECKDKANRDLRLIGTLNSIALDGRGDGGIYAAVMSNLGEGVSRRITGTRVGGRLDVQRRRANQMTEAYQAGVLTS